MSGGASRPPQEPSPLAPFCEALRDELDRRLARADAATDPVTVAERARALDPRAVSEAFVAATRDLAPVVPLAAARTRAERLGVFVEATRRHLDDQLAERALGPVGAPPPEVRRGGSGRWRPARAVAAAAAVLLFVGAGALAATRILAPSAGSAPAQAVRRAAPAVAVARAGGGSPVPAADSERGSGLVRRSETVGPAPTSDGVATASGGDGGPGPASMAQATDPEPPEHAAPPTGPALDARLAALDRKARAAWRAGELRRAERLFRRLVAEGGRHPRVEIALGELFLLADQRGASPARRQATFRRYLARFPRGRFASDARAGLCRLAPAPKAAACWRTYLARHPSGAHVAEARRAIKEAKAP